ncbi:MAG TPA: hypothetical protein VK747_21070 [Blastocatellia bacterium]|nr:hypothetical protein [Blastocatellia bacterium]
MLALLKGLAEARESQRPGTLLAPYIIERTSRLRRFVDSIPKGDTYNGSHLLVDFCSSFFAIDSSATEYLWSINTGVITGHADNTTQ